MNTWSFISKIKLNNHTEICKEKFNLVYFLKSLALKAISFSLFPLWLNHRNQGILIIFSRKHESGKYHAYSLIHYTEEQETMALTCVLHSDLIFKVTVFRQDVYPAGEEIATFLSLGVMSLNT